MTRLSEVLEDAVPVRDPSFGFDEVVGRARQRQRRRRAGAGGALLLALALVVGFAARDAGGSGPPAKKIQTVAPPPLAHAVFGVRTDTTLLFDAGSKGVVALNLDTGTRTARALKGARSGDQPFPLTRIGENIVVGWGEVWANPLLGGHAHKIADATFYVPETEPDLLWAISYPGGADSRIGNGTPTLRLLATNGQTLAVRKGPAPSVGTPVIGVAKRVVFELADGRLAIWDPTTGKLGTPFGGAGAQVGDTRGSTLSWCDGTCRTIHFTDVNTGADTATRVPVPVTDLHAARFQPGIARLAVPVEHGVILVDPYDRTAQWIMKVSFGAPPALAWAAYGQAVYASSSGAQPTIGRFDITAGRAWYATVDIAAPNSRAILAITNDEARTFLR
jgi:hypothetical protein